MEKTQVFLIHGGDTFRTHDDYLNYLKTRSISIKEKIRWREAYLKEALGDDFELIRPRMPLQDNAQYEDWKLHFERHFPLLKDNIILIGTSLGGVFLAKYLSENKFPKKILSTYLVCPPFDNSLPEGELVNGFALDENVDLSNLDNENTILMFSSQDNVVPVETAEKYKNKLQNAKIIIYDHIPGHFLISEFPEIIEMIKGDD